MSTYYSLILDVTWPTRPETPAGGRHTENPAAHPTSEPSEQMFAPRNKNTKRKKVVVVRREDDEENEELRQGAAVLSLGQSVDAPVSEDERTGAPATKHVDVNLDYGNEDEHPLEYTHGTPAELVLPPTTETGSIRQPAADESMAMDIEQEVLAPALPNTKKEKRVKKTKLKGAGGLALSFGDEEETEEVFLVKKSAASRRMTKNRTKKTHLAADVLPVSVATDRATVSVTPAYTTEHLAELRKNAVRAPSSGLGEVDDIVAQKFPLTFAADVGGGIPDANAVHAARLRRKMARESGAISPAELSEVESTAEDFIPLDGGFGSKHVGKYTGPSRLVREEDELDDGEGEYSEYIGDKIALTKKEIKERELERKEHMLASLETFEVASDEDDEQRDWEIDKIKKGGYAKMDAIVRTATTRHVERQRNKKIPDIIPIPTLHPVRKRLAEALAHVQAQRESYDRQLEQVRKDQAEALATVERLSMEIEQESERYDQHLAALREKLQLKDERLDTEKDGAGDVTQDSRSPTL